MLVILAAKPYLTVTTASSKILWASLLPAPISTAIVIVCRVCAAAERGLKGQYINLLLTVQDRVLSLTSMHSAPDMS